MWEVMGMYDSAYNGNDSVRTLYIEGICPVCGKDMIFVGIQGDVEFWFCSKCSKTWRIEFIRNNTGEKAIIKNLRDIQIKLIRNEIAQ